MRCLAVRPLQVGNSGLARLYLTNFIGWLEVAGAVQHQHTLAQEALQLGFHIARLLSLSLSNLNFGFHGIKCGHFLLYLELELRGLGLLLLDFFFGAPSLNIGL